MSSDIRTASLRTTYGDNDDPLARIEDDETHARELQQGDFLFGEEKRKHFSNQGTGKQAESSVCCSVPTLLILVCVLIILGALWAPQLMASCGLAVVVAVVVLFICR